MDYPLITYEVFVNGRTEPQRVECQSVLDRYGFVDFLRTSSTGEWVIVLRVQSSCMSTMKLVLDEEPDAEADSSADEEDTTRPSS